MFSVNDQGIHLELFTKHSFFLLFSHLNVFHSIPLSSITVATGQTWSLTAPLVKAMILEVKHFKLHQPIRIWKQPLITAFFLLPPP